MFVVIARKEPHQQSPFQVETSELFVSRERADEFRKTIDPERVPSVMAVACDYDIQTLFMADIALGVLEKALSGKVHEVKAKLKDVLTRLEKSDY